MSRKIRMQLKGALRDGEHVRLGEFLRSFARCNLHWRALNELFRERKSLLPITEL